MLRTTTIDNSKISIFNNHGHLTCESTNFWHDGFTVRTEYILPVLCNGIKKNLFQIERKHPAFNDMIINIIMVGNTYLGNHGGILFYGLLVQ